MSSKYAEIRTNYTDEDENLIFIDAWKTKDDNEFGTIIAKIHINTKTVEYLDDDARYDEYAQEEIEATLNEIERME